MGLLEIVEKAGSFMQTPGDKAVFERKKNGIFVGKLKHKNTKKSYVKYPNGTIVETLSKKA